MDDEAPLVLQSAARYGIAEQDALHAWVFAIDAYNVDQGMLIYIGPTERATCWRPASWSGVTDWRSFMPCVLDLGS